MLDHVYVFVLLVYSLVMNLMDKLSSIDSIPCIIMELSDHSYVIIRCRVNKQEISTIMQ